MGSTHLLNSDCGWSLLVYTAKHRPPKHQEHLSEQLTKLKEESVIVITLLRCVIVILPVRESSKDCQTRPQLGGSKRCPISKRSTKPAVDVREIETEASLSSPNWWVWWNLTQGKIHDRGTPVLMMFHWTSTRQASPNNQLSWTETFTWVDFYIDLPSGQLNPRMNFPAARASWQVCLIFKAKCLESKFVPWKISIYESYLFL